MGRIVVMNHVTLDGVMQSPGRPDEDPRGGFAHGGWALTATLGDDAGTAMAARMAAAGGLAGWLFGRRTYEDLLTTWNADPDSPFGPLLNQAQKYVASRTLQEPLPWPNSTLVSGDVPSAVSTLKRHTDGILGIMGSGELIGSLADAGLVDEYLLMIHPLVLGSGRRLLGENSQGRFRLLDCTHTDAGMIIASYEPITTGSPR